MRQIDYEILKINYKLKMIFFFFFISIPVFVSLQKNHADGRFWGYNLLFSASSHRVFDVIPTLPISQYIILILAVIYRDYLLKDGKKFFLYLIFPASVFVLSTGRLDIITSCFIIFAQAINFIVAKKIFQKLVPVSFGVKELVQSMYIPMSIIFLLKFTIDLVVYDKLTQFFLFSNIYIYNFADYFPVFYLLLVSIALRFMNQNTHALHKAFASMMIILSCAMIYMMLSKTIFYTLITFLCICGLFKYTKYNLKVNYSLLSLFFFSFVAIYMVVSFLLYGSFENGKTSLAVRSGIIYIFFSNLEFSDIFFPVISKGKSLLQHGMHNEYIEIYSALGLPFFIFFYFYLWVEIRKIFYIDKTIGLLLFLLVFFASLTQVNLLQSYSGILIAATLGSFIKISQNSREQSDLKN